MFVFSCYIIIVIIFVEFNVKYCYLLFKKILGLGILLKLRRMDIRDCENVICKVIDGIWESSDLILSFFYTLFIGFVYFY